MRDNLNKFGYKSCPVCGLIPENITQLLNDQAEEILNMDELKEELIDFPMGGAYDPQQEDYRLLCANQKSSQIKEAIRERFIK